MIDINLIRTNPELVKENIKKKFQDKKLPLVDEVIELDAKSRAAKQEADDLRAKRNQLSKQIGGLMKEGKKQEAEAVASQKRRDEAARQKIRESLADQRMLDELSRKKQEAEAVKARSEEFRKLVMEGTPQYGSGAREVIRYGK